MESLYEGSRRMDREARSGVKSQGANGFSPAITRGFQIVNGLVDAASNHSAEALKMAGDASSAMEQANRAHISGTDKAAVIRHLEIVDGHINNLGRKLGGSNDASNYDPAIAEAEDPKGSQLAETYAKECN